MIGWPTFANITQREIALSAHTRGETSADAPQDVARGSRALWRAQIAVAPMTAEHAFAFRAFLARLRGAFVPVMLPTLTERYPTTYTDGATFSDGATYDSPAATISNVVTGTITAGATSLTVAGTYTVGDLASIADNAGAQTVRIRAHAGGVLTFVPPLRRAYVNPTVSIGPVEIPMRLSAEAPPVPIVAGHRSPEVALQLEEYEP
jgi:hypothetical protein